MVDSARLSESILLSVAIPTFNRSNALVNTLTSIANQIGSIDPSSIEIIVSDNFSSDGTEECARAWIDEHPDIPIRYFRNDKNIGFDANCNAAIQRAAGVFVWLMSDDDFLETGAISTVHSLLEGNKDIAFAFVNYSVNIKNKIEESACHTTRVVRVSGGELMISTRFAFSLVSSCIFKRHLWLSGNASSYIGTGWIHMFMARDVLRSGQGLVIGSKLIRMNGLDVMESRKQARAHGHLIDAYISAHLKFVEYALSLRTVGYSDDVVKAAIAITWANNLRQIVFYKITAEQYSFAEITLISKRMARYFWKKWAFWIIHVPVFVLPNFVVAGLYRSLKPLYAKLRQMKEAQIGTGQIP